MKWLYVICSLLIVFGCNKNNQEPDLTREILSYPAYFPTPVYNFSNSSLSKEKIALGKQLFFDPILSADSSVACGSCHFQSYAFTDSGKKFSTGIYQQLGNRNTPSIVNMIWQTHFMWDGGINHIELMPLGPMHNEFEMHENIAHVVEKLNLQIKYRTAFKQAFGKSTIEANDVLFAMVQFLSTLISASSAYDEYRQFKRTFTKAEDVGYGIFLRHCNTCHTAPLFTNQLFENNGLDSVFLDAGRARITLLTSDSGKFKVPTLRNIALTAPYMHDGRFNSLPEVIDHYNEHILQTPYTSPKLSSSIHLNQSEKDALLAFLQTLTDQKYIQNEAFIP